ncbi:ribosomal protein L11 methyltransferase [Bacillus sp. B14905]|nr:ribosomal protein L11 methyltransferase [Bacillus sp. B14905]
MEEAPNRKPCAGDLALSFLARKDCEAYATIFY